ncbi:MAG: hypothetical protein KAJ18_07770, partial [Candidatus Omnitrophica bacterium]|nr:hypothetical protein [Candidatus Omnitrophota bacterium]
NSRGETLTGSSKKAIRRRKRAYSFQEEHELFFITSIVKSLIFIIKHFNTSLYEKRHYYSPIILPESTLLLTATGEQLGFLRRLYFI